MPYQSAGCCYTHFLIDVMMNWFDLYWKFYNNSDLSLFSLPDDSIDPIKDYYDLMTDRLRHQILEASPHARIQRQVGIIERVERNQCLSSYRTFFHYQTYLANVDNGNGGSLVAAAAAWQHQRRWRQHGGSGAGTSLVAIWRRRRQRGGGNSVAVVAEWRQQRSSIGAAMAAQPRWWQHQCCAVAAWQHDGGNMRMRWYKVFVVEVQNMYLWNVLHMIVS